MNLFDCLTDVLGATYDAVTQNWVGVGENVIDLVHQFTGGGHSDADTKSVVVTPSQIDQLKAAK